MYGAFGAFLKSWATDAGGAPGDGLGDMRRAVDELRGQNVLLFDGLLKIALAEAEARAGDPDRALALVDEELATAERTGYRAFEAELHRVRGEMLLQARFGELRAGRGSFPNRHRRRATATHAQLRACAQRYR